MEIDNEAGPSKLIDPSALAPRTAPTQPIPRTPHIHIEYPGVFSATTSDRTAQLHRALQTLSPHPPPYNNVGSALDHLGRLVNLQSKAIECRLGAWTASPTFGTGGDAAEGGERTTEDVYRHPIVGELVETNDLVAVVRRRVWTRRKKRRGKGKQGDAMEADPEDDEQQPTTHKEYTVDVLGSVKTTARWRKMADFAYSPDLNTADDDLIDIPGDPNKRGGILALHDALERMDVAAMRLFKVPEEKEDYIVTLPNGEKASNLRAIPPPIFTRVDMPFPYGFRQPSMSSLESYQRRLSDGSTVESQRWLNASRWKGLAPLQWSLKTHTDPPTQPTTEVAKMEPRCDSTILSKLREIFETRPVWTRAALINQLPDENMRRTVQFTKEYIPLLAYTVSDGAWRDSLVRLGYDVRATADSRFYQKISFQIPSSTTQKGRGSFKTAYGGAHNSSTGAQTAAKQQAAQAADDEEDDEAETASPSPAAAPAPATHAHKFDGETINRTTGTFTLCDIVDPLVQPYILAEGQDNILDQPTAETGWYTPEAFERIKIAVGVRYRHLMEHGIPAKREDVWKAVEGLVMRKAQRERKERGRSELGGEDGE